MRDAPFSLRKPQGKADIAVEIIKMWSLSPFRKYPRRTNCLRTGRG
jgi:hypothetical protein